MLYWPTFALPVWIARGPTIPISLESYPGLFVTDILEVSYSK